MPLATDQRQSRGTHTGDQKAQSPGRQQTCMFQTKQKIKVLEVRPSPEEGMLQTRAATKHRRGSFTFCNELWALYGALNISMPHCSNLHSVAFLKASLSVDNLFGPVSIAFLWCTTFQKLFSTSSSASGSAPAPRRQHLLPNGKIRKREIVTAV